MVQFRGFMGRYRAAGGPLPGRALFVRVDSEDARSRKAGNPAKRISSGPAELARGARQTDAGGTGEPK